MAFGLGSSGNSRSRDAATVELRALTGQFNRDVNEAERNWVESTRSMSREAIRLELAHDRLNRTLDRYKPGSAQAARALINLRDAEREAERAAQGFDRTLKSQQSSLGSMIKRYALYTGGVYALGRAFMSTVKVAGDFQRSMNIFGAVTEASVTQMAAARAEAIRLGKDITLPATSALDAANAMTELSKAGLDVKNSIGGGEGVLRLAAAANIEVGEAAKISSRSLNAFGLEGSQAARVADVFAAAANAATGEIPDFSLALSQSSNVARSWGLSIEETVATLAVFANNAIIGSDAGTSLRVMLTRLVPVSKAAGDKMKELGLTAFDAGGKIKPYRQIIQEYHDVLVKLPPEQQKLAIQTIFGQDAQRAANVVLVKGVQAYDKMLAAVSRTGAAQQLAAARNKGYAGSLDAFKSAVETFQISLGTALLPALTEALQGATEWINKMEESGELTREVTKAVEDVSTVVKGFVGIVKQLGDVLGPVVNAMGGLEETMKIVFGLWVVKRLGLITTGIAGMGTASATTAGQVKGLRVGLAGLGGPWPVQLAVSVVGGAIAMKALGAYLGDNVVDKIDGGGRKGRFIPGRGWVADQEITAANSDPRNPRQRGKNAGGRDPADKTQPATGTGTGTGTGGGGSGGDGLTQLQRLELAADKANLTSSLSDDLLAAKGLAAYYAKVASNESLKGDALFKARQDLLRAQQDVQQIEDQIASDRQQAVDAAAAKREAATKKRLAAQKKAMANQYRLDAEASNQLRKLYDKAPWQFGSDGQYHYVGPNGKTGGSSAKAEQFDPGALMAQFMANMQEVLRKYSSNLTVQQTFNTQADPDPAAMMRGGKYAAFALRAGMEG